MSRYLLLVSVLATVAAAQEPGVLKGRLSERPSGAPVSGALVRAETGDSTYSDDDGAFTLKLTQGGTINVTIEKPGYQTFSRGVNLDVTRNLMFAMIRPASLTGRVVDENGAPAADVKVQLWMPRSESPYFDLSTNPEGVFAATDAQPASFIARIVGAEPRVLDASADSSVIEQLPRDSYWPGGVDTRERALPVTLAPGLTGDFGTLRAETAPHYRVRIRTRDADCETLGSITIVRPNGSVKRETIECAREFVVAGLAAGTYTFGLFYGIENQQWALATVDVRREDQEVELALAPMGRVVGRIVPAEGASLEGFNDRIVTVTLVSEPFGLPTLIPDARPDGEGRFEFETVAWPLHSLRGPYIPGYFVESLRTGRDDGLVAIAPGGTANIEVVIDNRGATLTGTVPEGDHVVFLIGATSALADNGQFVFRNLPPGDYRAVAVPRGVAAVDPETLAPYATPVTLKRGETKSIQLRPPAVLR